LEIVIVDSRQCELHFCVESTKARTLSEHKTLWFRERLHGAVSHQNTGKYRHLRTHKTQLNDRIIDTNREHRNLEAYII
jgi:hypothetical protein